MIKTMQHKKMGMAWRWMVSIFRERKALMHRAKTIMLRFMNSQLYSGVLLTHRCNFVLLCCCTDRSLLSWIEGIVLDGNLSGIDNRSFCFLTRWALPPFAAIDTWSAVLFERRRLEALLTRVVNRWQRGTMTTAWNAWTEW